MTPMDAWTRIARRLAGLVLSSLLLGCMDNRITLEVDVASFLAPSDRSGPYDAPAGSPAVDHDLPPIEVRIEGYDQLNKAESVDLELEVRFDNQSGQGQVRFSLFFSDSATGLFETPAVAVAEAPLAPLTASTGTASIHGDARLLELFQNRQMWIGIRLHWAPETADALVGDYTITRLHATVVSNLDLL